jgi:methanethiol oxidase
MTTWIPDPTFYPSPRLAAGASPEKLATSRASIPNASATTSWLLWISTANHRLIGRSFAEMPEAGDELHHRIRCRSPALEAAASS